MVGISQIWSSYESLWHEPIIDQMPPRSLLDNLQVPFSVMESCLPGLENWKSRRYKSWNDSEVKETCWPQSVSGRDHVQNYLVHSQRDCQMCVTLPQSLAFHGPHQQVCNYQGDSKRKSWWSCWFDQFPRNCSFFIFQIGLKEMQSDWPVLQERWVAQCESVCRSPSVHEVFHCYRDP